MPNYKEKFCALCEDLYKPTSPNQIYCLKCRDKGKKIADRIRDRKRYRLKNDYKEYKRECLCCGTTFTTYYSSKRYCGATACEVYRRNKNLVKAENKRNLKLKLIRRINSAKNKALKLKEIKTFVLNNGYTLISAPKYRNTHDSKLTLRCPENHLWETSYHNFKDLNNRCPICYQQNNYVSKIEQELRTFIVEELKGVQVIYNDRNLISPKELDFYFPEHKLAIEVCGLYWHGEVSSGKSRQYHYNKMMECYDKGVRLITIFEDELYNYKDVVLSRVRQALNKPKKIIYARKCSIKEVDSKTANGFYDINHMQGRSTALIRYGLYYEKELVAVGSLGNTVRKHTSKNDTLELKRFCTKPGLHIIGGASKLFKYMKLFAKNQGYKYIKSYCDMRYANIFNPVYEILGFELEGFTKYTPHYFKNQKRYRNISLRKTTEERGTGKTEWELRKEQGYDRIWDCGHRTYVYVL